MFSLFWSSGPSPGVYTKHPEYVPGSVQGSEGWDTDVSHIFALSELAGANQLQGTAPASVTF